MDVHLVVDPWTRESRGFGFVTMATLEEADRCIKQLNNSVIEGRVITVEKVIVLSFSFLLTTCCFTNSWSKHFIQHCIRLFNIRWFLLVL